MTARRRRRASGRRRSPSAVVASACRLGIERLYPEQEHVIADALGGRDVLMVLPTGFGKSACYQIPSMVLAKPVVLISPLLALLRDQEQKLLERDIPCVRLDGTLGVRARRRHAANSAALLRDRHSWFEAVRPGLLLYGVVPRPLTAPPTLPVGPVMSLRSRIVAVKGMRPGDTVGYGARFTAGRPTRVAIVPAGHADGLDVRLSGSGSVLVRGRRVPIIGSVCMDSITVDVTELDVSPGDEVVMLGAQGDDRIDVSEMAEWIGTVPHEILCRTGSRIERVYTSSGSTPTPP